jgi:hypothetical protein
VYGEKLVDIDRGTLLHLIYWYRGVEEMFYVGKIHA